MKNKIYNIVIGAATFFAATLLACFGAHAQAPGITWQKSYGGGMNDDAKDCRQTADGGYIMAGMSGSPDHDVTGVNGVYDFWITKLTSTGTISWSKAIGSTTGDVAQSIVETADGGYLVAGYSLGSDSDVSVNHGGWDYWVVKLTSTGAISWEKSFGGAGNDYAYSAKQTYDGGYIVTGYTESVDGDITTTHGNIEVLVLKLSATGTVDWKKTLGSTGDDFSYEVIQTADTGYVLVGSCDSVNGDVTSGHGQDDIWVVKLTKTGAISWEKSLGGTDNEWANDVKQTSDGNLIITGATASTDGDVTGSHAGDEDLWIVKLSSTGGLLWQKAYGGTYHESGQSILETAGGGFIVAGLTGSSDGDVTSNHGGLDAWVLKISATGAIQWQKSIGGSNTDECYGIVKTTDGGYFIGGLSSSSDGDLTSNYGGRDSWAIKLDACTPPAPAITVTGATIGTTVTYTTYQWKLTGAPIAGATNATYTASVNGDYSVDVTDGNGCPATSPVQTVTIPTGIRNTDMQAAGISIYPNPSNGSVVVNLPTTGNIVEIAVTDILGNTVATASHSNSYSRSASFNLDNIPSGNYIIKVTDGDKVYRDKLMVIK